MNPMLAGQISLDIETPGPARAPRKFSDQARANMSAAHVGLKHSPEHRQAIAAAAKPENIAKASSAARTSVAGQLELLGAVTLPTACGQRGVDYSVAYTWATCGRSDRLRSPFFRGPRGDICCRQEEFDAALEESRCKEAGCERYALNGSGLCHEHAAAKRARERFEAEAMAVRREVPGGLWLAQDVMEKIAVSRPYLSRTLVPSGQLKAELRVIAGRRCLAFRPSDVRAFQRSRPVSRWHNPEWVRRHVLNNGMVDRRAEREGISKAEALEQYLAEGELRRRRPAGRPPGQRAAHHYEWLDRYRAIRENHEAHAYGGQPMPKPLRMCLEVALEDQLEHPERWPDYDPVSLAKQASDRVWTAIKSLQIAESEIPRGYFSR